MIGWMASVESETQVTGCRGIPLPRRCYRPWALRFRRQGNPGFLKPGAVDRSRWLGEALVYDPPEKAASAAPGAEGQEACETPPDQETLDVRCAAADQGY